MQVLICKYVTENKKWKFNLYKNNPDFLEGWIPWWHSCIKLNEVYFEGGKINLASFLFSLLKINRKMPQKTIKFDNLSMEKYIFE